MVIFIGFWNRDGIGCRAGVLPAAVADLGLVSDMYEGLNSQTQRVQRMLGSLIRRVEAGRAKLMLTGTSESTADTQLPIAANC